MKTRKKSIETVFFGLFWGGETARRVRETLDYDMGAKKRGGRILRNIRAAVGHLGHSVPPKKLVWF